MEKTIRVKWIKSVIGRTEDQKQTIRGLGFRRLQQTLTLPDRPEIRGMINRVVHLLEVNPVRNSSRYDSKPSGASNSAGDHSGT